ncbi:Aste57867_10012 [Aphanomyces stellatus]|uniref:Aste57867_10012 protein n=1 Tax=Aphanomyces stellatus TaxID=120398 RepID=A0A485KPL8_9STRA|nr:hypothetical protein As57867_009973 [Aphanomyces stellatus]VFT86890.1 Aste57867_10012 [Aphanomyces stellatus]
MINWFSLKISFLGSLAAYAHGLRSGESDPAAIVVAGNARFSVLTPQLIRMEWGEGVSAFRDAQTLVVNNRKLPVPQFKTSEKDQWIEIETSNLKISYDMRSRTTFSDANLRVEVVSISDTSNRSAFWTPSLTDKDPKRLFGTLRTLDMTDGPVTLDCNSGGPDAIADSHCTYGLISRSGYVVVDDSLTMELDNDPWPWLVEKKPKAATNCSSVPKEQRRVCGYNVVSQDQCDANGCCFDDSASLPNGFSCFYGDSAYQDLYFFGHGLRFKEALKDFTLIAGDIPLPPKYSLGVFYSRWWAYNDVEIDQIAGQYSTRGIPLDVVVLDMDWHLTFYKNSSADQSGQPKGWTGYTWNKELFPNPKAFLSHLHELGLHVTANLHPASGVQPWEDSYEQVAKSMGIDPASQRYVPFEMMNKTFATNWLKLSLKPREEEGVDFWWLDWQQGEDWFMTHDHASPNLNPTIWLNHVFFTNPYHWTTKRPVLLHRFGGLGNHRYPLGFSGDVVPSWKSLDFQPYFTATAANVGFTYWSHDIGGFQHGNNPELFTRWVQWGVFSPVLRTHSTKDKDTDRRIWSYPDANYEIMRKYINLRRRMMPYIYTQCRLTHETGLGMLHGLYYEWPEFDESYSYSRQYLFGSAFIIAPIVTPVDNSTKLAKKNVWIPPGTWFDMTLGSIIHGPAVYTHSYSLAEVPWFAKAGSIIPFAPQITATSLGQAQSQPSPITLVIVPGLATGHGVLYEDQGDSQKYLNQEFAWFSFSYVSKDNEIETTIHEVKGTFPDLPSTTSYILDFKHAVPADLVLVDDRKLNFIPFGESDKEGWRYDAEGLTLRVYLKSDVSVSASTVVRVKFLKPSASGFTANLMNGVVGGMARLQEIKLLLDLQPVYAEDFPKLRHALGTSRRILYNPSSFFDEIVQWHQLIKVAIVEIQQLKLPGDVQSQILLLLHDSFELVNSPAVLSHATRAPLVVIDESFSESFLADTI